MRVFFRACAFVALSSGLAAGQSPLPVQQPAQPAAAGEPYTLKSNTQRVLVDVVVKDKSGKAVHGLKASDFQILENGVPQDVRGFDEHTALTTSEAAAVAPLPKMAPGDFTNLTATPPNSAVNVILLDKLNTAQKDQLFVRQQLVQYLKHARPDSRIAIFALTDHLVLLQGFTSNPAILLKALDMKDGARASALRDETLVDTAGVDDFTSLENILARAGFDQTLASVQAFDAEATSFQTQLQSKYTLDALNLIGRSMAAVPGRKNLIWFTGNFPSGLFPGDNDPNVPYGQFAGLEDEFRETVNLMTSNQIAIYPVDGQGLRTLSNNNATESNPQFGSIKGSTSRSGLAVAVASTKESTGIAGEHLGMTQLAHDTGGTAFFSHSDLARAVDEAISSGSNYYTIAYSPANPEKKSTFRRITVKTSAGSYELSYRRGYYTDQPKQKIAGAADGPQAPAAPSALRTALLQGGPEPNEILMKVHAAPISTGGETSVTAGNMPNPDASKIHGPFRTYQVDLAASMKNVLIRHTSDNMYHADVAVIVYVYDTNGTLINAQSNTVRTNYTAAELAGALRTGLGCSQKVSVPQRGEHFLRVAVHDNIGGKVGAVEIPVSALSTLPVAVASSSPAAMPTP